MKKTAIFAASLWEIGGVLKSAEFSYKKVRETPYQVWENDTKTVVITRIGLANAATAFSWAASELDFESAINIGAAGAASPKFDAQELGEIFDVRSVSCIEPYCGEVFEMQTMGGCETATLATSSRPVASAKDREQVAGMGELVDMEGWALACAAKAFSKKLYIRKILTDFSPECDIHSNILSICRILEKLENFWI